MPRKTREQIPEPEIEQETEAEEETEVEAEGPQEIEEAIVPFKTKTKPEIKPKRILTESQFEEIYKHATSEPYNALVIDNHPKVDRDKRFKKNFNVVLTHGS